MSNQQQTFKFRSTSIDPDAVDELARQKGCESRAELLRALVRESAQRHEITLSEG
jgi:hypothetical protein